MNRESINPGGLKHAFNKMHYFESGWYPKSFNQINLGGPPQGGKAITFT